MLNQISCTSLQNESPGEIQFAATQLSHRERNMHDCAIRRVRSFKLSERELLESVEEVDRTQLYVKFKKTSSFAYWVDVQGLSEHVALTFIRVARKSREVPELLAALGDGGLTVSKVRQIVSVLTPENQQEWLEKARRLSKNALEKEVAKLNPAEAIRERLRAVGEDRYRLETEFCENGAQDLRRAQDLCSQSEREHVNFAETIQIALTFYLNAKDPVRKADRLQSLKKAADAQLSQMKIPTKIVDLAPTPPTRPVRKPLPASVRHAVHARDRGRCQAQLSDRRKCQDSRWVDLHHVLPVSAGGRDVAENLTTLCSHHHRLWHARDSSRDE